ncbi:CGNR zinc finger domain-containing protein [Tunturiibacter empetritectus]|uniref:CGNR zinc finger domain-containing protein n=1 Tax=Tunturiibacter empetritectus TaxID=3069691 RepID=UPI003D9ACA8A
MPTPTHLPPSIEPPKAGDHPALDLLNTVFLLNGTIVDSLQTDQDVLLWARRRWLASRARPRKIKARRPPAQRPDSPRSNPPTRRSQKSRQARRPGSLNAFLAQSQSHLKLSPAKGRTLHLERQWRQRTPEEILAPIAEAAAELLATGDFNLVRHCEAPECVLWFYDRTRSHHRRWCSMATCGNRNKVAAFRHRQSTT